MATRDLSYLIGFDVTGTAELQTATTSMEGLAAATQQVDEAPDTLPLEVPENLSGDLDAVGESMGALPEKADNANTSAGFLESTFGKVTAGAVFVGEAIDIVNQFVDIGTRLWDAYNAKQQLTDDVTRAVSDALLEQSGAMEIINRELTDLVDNASDPSQVLNASIWEGIEAEQGAEEVQKIRTALLDVGLTFDDLGATIIAFENDETRMATSLLESVASIDTFNAGMADAERQAGLTHEQYQNLANTDFPAFVDQLGAAIAQGDSFGEILDQLPPELRPVAEAFRDQIEAIEQLNDAQENVDYGDLISQQLEAAESSEELRAVLEDVRGDLGPDASDLDVWTEYVSRLQEAQGAADETAGAIEGATDAAGTPIDIQVDTEQAHQDLNDLKDDIASFDSTKQLGAPNIKIPFGADTTQAEEDIAEVTEADHETTVEVDADTAQAVEDIDTATEARTLDVTLGLVNGAPFDQVIDNHTADRTIDVDLATRTVSLPSASQLVAQVTGGAGRIIVPLVGRWSTRIEGSRPT